MKVGNVIGTIKAEDYKKLNYFEIINELIKLNMGLKTHNYIYNLTEFQFCKDKNVNIQRLIITRIFIRHLLMAKALSDLPHVEKVIKELDIESSNLVWLDKMQTKLIPYCNEYKVFEIVYKHLGK